MKNYLIIGNKNAVTYKEVFPLFKDRKMWIGWNQIKWFEQPDGSKTDKIGGLSRWFTNLPEVEGATLLDKYCPEQFDIVDINPHFYGIIEQGLPKPKQLCFKDGRKDPYARILIKKR